MVSLADIVEQLCKGCRKIMKEASCKVPTTISLGIEMEEQDEEFKTIIAHECDNGISIKKYILFEAQ